MTEALTAEPDGLLAIGRVARAHGLKGELRVEPFFDGSDTLAQVKAIWLSPKSELPAGAREHALEWARPVPKAFLVKLVGVSDRNASEALRGHTVWVARTALPASQDDEYYLVDLLGAKVVGPEGEVGEVVEIATHPSVDAIVIRTADGSLVEQPLLPQFVTRVAVAEKLVELSSLDGLIS